MRKQPLLTRIGELFKPLVRYTLLLYKFNLKFRVGLLTLTALILFGAISVATPPHHWKWFVLPKDQPPSLSSIDVIMGTTTNGRSVFWASTNAVLNSLVIAILTALIASHVGLFIGLVAGYRGGLIDRTLMFITDSFVVIPQLPLLILLAMLLRDILTIPFMALLISVSSWPWPARQVRAMVISLREREFVSTAILTGIPEWQVILKEIMPHLLGWHLINATNTVLYAIGAEVGLSVLGLSILSIDTLGTMIYWSMIGYPSLFRGVWWWPLPPIILTIVVFVSLYLVSTAIAESIESKRGVIS
ncbi:ABC transporter permease [Infirmifilum lucidum]|uniref:ABC transporter permease n=1 Tax=Infirmifilum lucidum TaxID=2776706 RepID=A0A7L9FGB3_9CREN|nr:ABC transporter permease [Infirmifilum lucidum]QOJ78840.1 ABC transporter permease [Infirmifilum lucidum]